jgi:hypothetical protein
VFGEEMEGIGRGLLKLLCWYFLGGVEENNKYANESNRTLG